MRRALLLALLLGSCSPVAVPLQREPSGVASLNPCTDAILAEVADPAQISALSAYSRDPASSSMDVNLARRLPSTGGTVEELAALRPAVVLSGTFTPPATHKALEKLGIPLVELPIASSVDESLVQVRRIAELAGHPARGEALVARIEAALAAAKPQESAIPISAVVWQSGGIVPGDQTLITDLLRRTGFTSFSAAKGLRQADFLPLEAMLADPPQLILAAGGHGEEDRLLAHPALASLPQTRRATLAPSLLWCGGPTIISAAARLDEIRRSMPPFPQAGGGGDGQVTDEGPRK